MERFIRHLVGWFGGIAGIAMIGMLCVSVVDILSTKIFKHPIIGSIDIIGLLGLICAIFAISWTQLVKRHVCVDSVISRLKERQRWIMAILSSILSLVIFTLVIWSCILYAMQIQSTKDSSATIQIPLYPFDYAIAFACIPLLLVIIFELLNAIKKVKNK